MLVVVRLMAEFSGQLDRWGPLDFLLFFCILLKFHLAHRLHFTLLQEVLNTAQILFDFPLLEFVGQLG